MLYYGKTLAQIHMYMANTFNFINAVAAPEIFFVGGIEGAKCNSEGQKSKNLLKMADFGHFFLLTGGASGKW